LRALWTEWSVEVRVLFGALEKPRRRGAFLLSGGDHVGAAENPAVEVALIGGGHRVLTDGEAGLSDHRR
jgi:hypothetical protein